MQPASSVELVPALEGAYRVWTSPNGDFVAGQMRSGPTVDQFGASVSLWWGSRARIHNLDQARYRLVERSTGKVKEEAGILLGPPTDRGDVCHVVAGDPPRVVGPAGRAFDLPSPPDTTLDHLLADSTCEHLVAQFAETRHLGLQRVVGLDSGGTQLWEVRRMTLNGLAMAPSGGHVALGTYLLPVNDGKTSPSEGTIKHAGIVVVDAKTGALTSVIDLDELGCHSMRLLAFSRDDRRLFSVSQMDLLVADLSNGKSRVVSNTPSAAVDLTDDGGDKVWLLSKTAAAADSAAMIGMESASPTSSIYEVDLSTGKWTPFDDPKVKGRTPGAIGWASGAGLLLPVAD